MVNYFSLLMIGVEKDLKYTLVDGLHKCSTAQSLLSEGSTVVDLPRSYSGENQYNNGGCLNTFLV